MDTIGECQPGEGSAAFKHDEMLGSAFSLDSSKRLVALQTESFVRNPPRIRAAA